MKEFKLDNEPRIKTGFKVPDNYFDSFTDKVMQQVSVQDTKVVPLYRKRTAWLSGIAAVFVIALTISMFFIMNNEEKYPDDAVIESYLVYHSNISSYDLIYDLDDEDLKELELSLAISDDAIESYFENYGDDIYLKN